MEGVFSPESVCSFSETGRRVTLKRENGCVEEAWGLKVSTSVSAPGSSLGRDSSDHFLTQAWGTRFVSNLPIHHTKGF